MTLQSSSRDLIETIWMYALGITVITGIFSGRSLMLAVPAIAAGASTISIVSVSKRGENRKKDKAIEGLKARLEALEGAISADEISALSLRMRVIEKQALNHSPD